MNTTRQKPRATSPTHYAANELALSLAQAETALRALTSDQVDAIVDPDGKAYLLRPAQERLRENERRLEAVIESAADVITVVNRQGTILSQSRPVNRVLGYEQEELIGSNLFELVSDEDLAAVHSAFFNVVEGIQDHATAQFKHRTRDGGYRMVEATLGRLCEAGSASVVFSLRPVSQSSRESVDFERRESEGIRAALQKDRFLAMLAHELRTPLMPVLLCIGEMQEDMRFASAAPMLAMMRRNIELQSRLLGELSDFTTVGHHKVRLRLEPIDLHQAIRFVLEICQSEIASARVRIELDLRASENMVCADALRLQQVLWNLLRNAIKFSPAGSSISIASANRAPHRVTVEFADHGIGIEPNLLPLVFDPFQQGERMLDQKLNGGRGLGMFIAKGLAEAQDGSLMVSSDGQGLGATFRLTLNLAPAPGATPARPAFFEFKTPVNPPEIG